MVLSQFVDGIAPFGLPETGTNQGYVHKLRFVDEDPPSINHQILRYIEMHQ
jgi:hypothetical protein